MIFLIFGFLQSYLQRGRLVTEWWRVQGRSHRIGNLGGDTRRNSRRRSSSCVQHQRFGSVNLKLLRHVYSCFHRVIIVLFSVMLLKLRKYFQVYKTFLVFVYIQSFFVFGDFGTQEWSWMRHIYRLNHLEFEMMILETRDEHECCWSKHFGGTHSPGKGWLDPKSRVEFSHWKSSSGSSSSSWCETEEELLLIKGVDRWTSPSNINNLTLCKGIADKNPNA